MNIGYLRRKIVELISLETNVLVLSLTGSLLNFAAQTFQPFTSLYLMSLGADVAQVGLAFAFLSFAIAIVTLPGGMIADRFGRKMLIVAGNFTGFLCYFLLVLIGSWQLAVIILFIQSLMSTFYQPAYTAIIAESVPDEERGNAFGTFFFIVSIGFFVGPMIGGYLYSFGGFSTILYGAGFLGVSGSLMRLVWIRETLIAKPRKTVDRLKTERSLSHLPHFGRDLKFLAVVSSMVGFVYGVMFPYVPVFATEILKIPKFELGVMFSVSSFAQFMISLPAGKIIRKVGTKMLMMIANICSSALIVPWIYSPSIFFAICIYTLTGIFTQLFTIANQTLTSNLTSIQTRASTIGVITTVSGLVGAVSPYLGSLIWIRINPQSVFLVVTAVGLLTSIPLIAIKGRVLIERDTSSRLEAHN
jgi:MFS family permease